MAVGVLDAHHLVVVHHVSAAVGRSGLLALGHVVLRIEGVNSLLVVDEHVHQVGGKAQSRQLAAPIHNVATVLGVQVFQLLDVDSYHMGYLFEVNVAVEHDGVGLGGQVGRKRADVVLAIVIHDVVGGYEGGHISACLLWQQGVDLPIVLLALQAVDRLVDLLRSTVVCGDDQVPVAKDLVEVAQVMGGGV